MISKWCAALVIAYLTVSTLLGGDAGGHARGVELYRQKQYAQAIAALEEAAKGELPGSVEYKESALLIGQSYFQLSQSPKAIPWLEKVTGVNEANYMLGYAYLQAGQQESSVAAFARLFGVEAKSAAAYLLAGQMMLKQEYEAEAELVIKRALALDPKLPEVHFLLGEVAIYSGRFAEGAAAMQEELKLNPNFAMAWYRLGDAFSRQEKWRDAIPDLQRAVWLNPNFSGPFILLGKCYLKLANYPNAEGILRRGLVLDPRNLSGTYLLAQTLVLEGKQAEGKAMLEHWKSLQQEKEPVTLSAQP